MRERKIGSGNKARMLNREGKGNHLGHKTKERLSLQKRPPWAVSGWPKFIQGAWQIESEDWW